MFEQPLLSVTRHLCSACAAPPKSISAPKKKVERTQSHKPRPTPSAVADDNLPMASSLDHPLIQNNMLGARDATVLPLARNSCTSPLHKQACIGVPFAMRMFWSTALPVGLWNVNMSVSIRVEV